MKTAPTTAAASLDDAIRAAQQYIAAAVQYIHALPAPIGSVQWEMPAELTAEVRRVCNAYRNGSAEPGIEEVQAVLAQHLAEGKALLGRGGIHGPIQGNMGAARVGEVLPAFLGEFGDLLHQTELRTAQRELADLETALREATADLETAVGRGDLEAVLAKRPTVEIEIPRQIGAARSTVLRLKAERADAAAQVPRRAAELASEALTKAERAVTDAQAALAAAEASRVAALVVERYTDTAAATLTAAANSAHSAATRHDEQERAEQTRRLRQLAGLPDTPAPATAAPVTPTPAQRPSAGARGSITTTGQQAEAAPSALLSPARPNPFQTKQAG
jgi:phage gp16-like protein